MKNLVNVNGKISSPETACVSVFDRGFLYGDSVYEVTFTHNRKPFQIEEHLERLWASAAGIFIPVDYTKEQIIEEVQKTIDSSELNRAYIRIVLTRGAGEITLDPAAATKNNLIIILKELPPNPKDWYEKGISLMVAQTLRNSPMATPPNVKSGNYLNNVMAFDEAMKVGAFDAVMLNSNGNITECTTSNIWMIKDGKLITPTLSAGILGGITRKNILSLKEQFSLPIVEQDFTEQDLKSADECFISSSTKYIVPVTKLDGAVVGDGTPGKYTRELLKLFLKHFELTI